MEGSSTEVLADLDRRFGTERQNSCDADKTAGFECLGCGNDVFRHVRDLRGRSLWECVTCGNPVETPIQGGRWA